MPCRPARWSARRRGWRATAAAGELRLSAPVQALLDATRSRHADVTPLAGRDRDLAALQGALARVRQRGARGAGDRSSASPGSASRGSSASSPPAREPMRRCSSGTARPTATASPTGRCARSCCRRSAGAADVGHRADRGRARRGGDDRGDARARRTRSADAAPWAFRMLFNTLARARPLVLALRRRPLGRTAAARPRRRARRRADGGARAAAVRRPARAADHAAGLGARRRSCGRRRWTSGQPPPADAGPPVPAAALDGRGRASARATRCSSSSWRPTCASAARPARSRRRCTRCWPPASTRSARPSAG